MTLKEYRQKRRSGRSPEPRGRRRRGSRKQPRFVIQHHAADDDADALRRPMRSQPESVLSGRTLDELS